MGRAGQCSAGRRVDAAHNMGGRGVVAAQSSEATGSMEKEEEKGAGR
jgi:hypothetical protein